MVIFNSYVTNYQRVNTVKKGILPWLAEYLSTVFLWDPHLGRNARNGVRRRRHSFEIECDHRFRLPFHTANPMYVFMLSYLISVYMYIWMPYSYIYIHVWTFIHRKNTAKIRHPLEVLAHPRGASHLAGDIPPVTWTILNILSFYRRKMVIYSGIIDDLPIERDDLMSFYWDTLWLFNIAMENHHL